MGQQLRKLWLFQCCCHRGICGSYGIICTCKSFIDSSLESCCRMCFCSDVCFWHSLLAGYRMPCHCSHAPMNCMGMQALYRITRHHVYSVVLSDKFQAEHSLNCLHDAYVGSAIGCIQI